MAGNLDQAELKRKFDAVDLDESGKIDAAEFVEVIKTMLMDKGMGESDADTNAKASVHAILKRYDTDGDRKISWDEFVAAMDEDSQTK